MSSRFVIGRVGLARSNSGLSRLVSLSSSPPTCQTPSLPSASRAASSSSVTRQRRGLGLGGGPGGLRRPRPSAFAAFAGSSFAVVGRAWPHHRRVGRRGVSASAARTALGRRDRALAADGRRVAARLDALVGGLADDAVARPAAELGADHELRPDPGDATEVAAPAAAVVLAAAAGRTADRRSTSGCERSRAGPCGSRR